MTKILRRSGHDDAINYNVRSETGLPVMYRERMSA